MKLFIVRHGQTEANLRNECQGHLPGVLTPQGAQEAGIVGRALKDCFFDVCFCSDLQRALDTAHIIKECHSQNDYPIEIDSRLRERYFGPLQGKKFPIVWDEDLYTGKVESIEEMRERLIGWMEDLKKSYPQGSVLVVSHGFTIQLLLAILSGYPTEEISRIPIIGNCSLSEVEIDILQGEISVYSINRQLSEL